jgi:SAM-dependent methyltransferase
MNLREVNCYNCNSEMCEPYAEENGFRLVRCKGCGLLYVRKRPDDSQITDAHQAGQHGGSRSLDVTGSFSKQKVVKYSRVLTELYGGEAEQQGSPLRWLDIGCGHGEFLLAIQEFFGPSVRARGIEPNVAKQVSARRHGADVSYFELSEHNIKYSRLSLLNVYSHLPDPPATLGAWRRLLLPGGEILLQTGDTANLCSKDHYRPFYLPDHLSFASESIVVGILERVGFEILAVRKYPLLEAGPVTWVKEGLKVIWPGKSSRLRYLLGNQHFSETDMYIRARLRSA